MTEDPGAVAVTAGVNALAALVRGLPWPEIGVRIRGVLSRRGRSVQPALVQAMDDNEDSTRELRLVDALAQLPSEDRAAVISELESLKNQTMITISGGKNAIHSGSGDQNVTFD